MKAISVDPSTQKLIWSEAATPKPKINEALVKVHASAVNRADILQRLGKYPVPKGASEIIGLEASGVIESLNSDSTEFKIGDKVFFLLSGGGYAEYVNVPVEHLMLIPANLNFEEAASIPEAFFTAYLNLCVEGNLKKGESVLIHAAASGVGGAAVQLAVALGARVFATAGSKEKCEFVKSLGAIDCIDYKSEDFLQHYGEKSIDLVLDMVGQKHLSKNLQVLKYRGRLVMLSLISGAKAEIDLIPLLRNNLTIKGSTLRDRSNEEKAQLTQAIRKIVLPLLESKIIKPIISKIFPIQEAQLAHEFVEANLNLGKVVLKVC